MAVAQSIFSHFGAFLMCIFLTLVPYKGIVLPVTDTLEENCRLNVELISDTHLEENEIFRALFLKTALKNFNNSKVSIDAVVINGDLTNYADEPTLAKFFGIIEDETDIPVIAVAGNHDIGHAGDRGVTDISREEAYANYLRYRNEYMGRNDEANYFSTQFNGYKFIVIGDEVLDGGKWDGITMTQEQLDFLDTELAEGTKDGKPVFVFCHWPLEGTVSENIVWPECGIEKERYDIAAILEKYKNVFWISGHMHSGTKAEAADRLYGIKSCEQINGVTYITLPSFGLVNSFGLPLGGRGAQLEVYDGKVVFRPRNMLTGNWYKNAEYTFELV